MTKSQCPQPSKLEVVIDYLGRRYRFAWFSGRGVGGRPSEGSGSPSWVAATQLVEGRPKGLGSEEGTGSFGTGSPECVWLGVWVAWVWSWDVQGKGGWFGVASPEGLDYFLPQ